MAKYNPRRWHAEYGYGGELATLTNGQRSIDVAGRDAAEWLAAQLNLFALVTDLAAGILEERKRNRDRQRKRRAKKG